MLQFIHQPIPEHTSIKDPHDKLLRRPAGGRLDLEHEREPEEHQAGDRRGHVVAAPAGAVAVVRRNRDYD